MIEIDKLILISGQPFKIREDLFVYPPHLSDIVRIGKDTYNQYLSMFITDSATILSNIGAEIEEDIDPIKLITLVPPLREIFLDALSFFIHEDVMYDEHIGYFYGDEKTINFDEIKTIKYASLIMSCVDTKEAEPVKFANSMAKEIYEKVLKRKGSVKTQKDADFDLYNIVGAVCAFHGSINLLNVWDLTVYQFYDQFSRINTKIQMDVVGQRWAAWGKDEFDFSLWHKAAEQK